MGKMKVLLVLAVAAAVSAHSGEDYKMFMKWAKGKAMESCWGEDNMKLLTLNMKKAVSKCMQEDAPELDLPPFRYMNRFTNSLVSMANSRSQDQDLYKMMKFMVMMKMMQQVGSDNLDHHSFRTPCYEHGYGEETGKYRNNMDRMDNGNMMENMMKMMSRMMNKEGQYERSEYDNMDMYDMFSKMCNMPCVLREMNVLNSRNNIDIAAMKADTEN